MQASAPSIVRTHLLSGDSKRLDEAVSLAESMTNDHPEVPQAHWWHARACAAKAASAGAVKSVSWWRCHGHHLREAVRLQPANSEWTLALVQFLSRAPWLVGGDRGEANAQQARLAVLDASSGLVASAHLLYADGKLEPALQALQRALSSKPAHPEALAALVDAIEAHRRLEEGSKWVQAAIATKPSDPRARWAIVRYAALSGESSAIALSHLEALEHDPELYVAPWEMAWRRGQLLGHAKRWQEAVAVLSHAQSLRPASKAVADSLKLAQQSANSP